MAKNKLIVLAALSLIVLLASCQSASRYHYMLVRKEVPLPSIAAQNWRLEVNADGLLHLQTEARQANSGEGLYFDTTYEIGRGKASDLLRFCEKEGKRI